MAKLSLVMIAVLTGCCVPAVQYPTRYSHHAFRDTCVTYDAEFDGDPNPNDYVVPGGLARFAKPDAAAIARAFSVPGVRAQLAACRADYGVEVASVAAHITVAPSGSVAEVALTETDDASDVLGACVARTLHAVTLAAFTGDPVTFDQTLTL